MSFFKAIASGIEKTAEIGKLDKIVERRVAQYEREVTDLIQNLRKIYTPEQIAELEQQVIDRCLRDYDGEAVPYMGRAVNPDWKEGGGDNLEVRKRMLNRDLEKRRGKLAAAVNTLKGQIQIQLDSLTVFIQQSEHQIKSTLPSDQTTIDNQFAALRQNVAGLVSSNYPGGLAQFDALANGEIEQQLKNTRDLILGENQRLRVKAIRDYRQKAFTKLYDALYVGVAQTANTVKADLKIDDNTGTGSNIITVEVIEDVRKEMDHVVSRILSDFRSMNDLH